MCVFPGRVLLPLPAAVVALLQPVGLSGLSPLLLQDLGVIQSLQAGDLTDDVLPEEAKGDGEKGNCQDHTTTLLYIQFNVQKRSLLLDVMSLYAKFENRACWTLLLLSHEWKHDMGGLNNATQWDCLRLHWTSFTKRQFTGLILQSAY